MIRLPEFALIATFLIGFACSHDYNAPEIKPDIDQLIVHAKRLQVSNPDSAISIARKAYEQAEKHAYIPGQAQSALFLGEQLYRMGSFSPALTQLNTAHRHFSSLDQKTMVAEVDILKGNVYQRTENYPQAFQCLYTALALYESLNDDTGKARAYGSIGHLFEKQGSYDSAISYQVRAMDLYAQIGDTLGLAAIHDNVGSIYEDLGKYDEAFEHFEKALLLNRSIDNQAEAIINLNNLGDVYRKKGDYEQAITLTLQALKEAEAAGLDYQVKSACRDLSKIYDSLHRPTEAFRYLERSYELTHQIFSEQIASEIAKAQAIYELEQKQQRILLLEKERQFNHSLSLLSASGAFVVLLLATFIVYQQKSKNTKKRKLLLTEAELARAELENTQLNELKLKTELENKLLKEEQLQQELDLKSKSLTKSALQMIQKNELLTELRERLKEVKKGKTDLSDKRIKKLIHSIDINFSIDDDWQEFETIFQQVHSEFFKKLMDLYPTLSPSEVRLCAMIRLNLHSKDMAAIMGISQDSLRIARYRLRKSLGLDKGANLYSFIINIG